MRGVAAISLSYLPLAPEHIDLALIHIWMLDLECRGDLLLKVRKELLLPEAQSLGIVTADVLNLLHDEGARRLIGDVVDELRCGRKVSAGEYVVVDEAVSETLVSNES